MAKYRLKICNNEKSTGYGKYYAHRVAEKLIDTEALAKRMAARSTTFSEGEMRGILIDLTELIKELTFDGNSVKLGDLGIFFLTCKSKGVTNPADFNASTDITSRFRMRGTGNTRDKQVGMTRANGVEIVWEEDNEYQSPRLASPSNP